MISDRRMYNIYYLQFQAIEDGKEKLVPQGTLMQHENWIICLGKQGEYLFSGADDKKIKVWDIKSCKLYIRRVKGDIYLL